MRITGGKNNEKKRVILNKSFTLIELLVVVAIIGILASLLLPVLGKTRKKAKQVVCKSQLRQINTAMIMYSDDNDQQCEFFGLHLLFRNSPHSPCGHRTESLSPRQLLILRPASPSESIADQGRQCNSSKNGSLAA